MSRRLRFAALLPLTLLLSSVPLGIGLRARNRRGPDHGARPGTPISGRPIQPPRGIRVCRPRRPISIGSSSWARTGGYAWRSSISRRSIRARRPSTCCCGAKCRACSRKRPGPRSGWPRSRRCCRSARSIHDLETARRHWGVLDGQAAASKVAELAGAVKQVREHLPKPGGKPVSAAVALRTAATVHELQEVLKRWYSFYDGYQPDFAWWLKKPYEDAAKQLDEYAKYLREEVAQVKGQGRRPAGRRADRGRGPGRRHSPRVAALHGR